MSSQIQNVQNTDKRLNYLSDKMIKEVYKRIINNLIRSQIDDQLENNSQQGQQKQNIHESDNTSLLMQRLSKQFTPQHQHQNMLTEEQKKNLLQQKEQLLEKLNVLELLHPSLADFIHLFVFIELIQRNAFSVIQIKFIREILFQFSIFKNNQSLSQKKQLDVRFFLKHCKLETFSKREKIFGFGELGQKYYMLLKGKVLLFLPKGIEDEGKDLKNKNLSEEELYYRKNYPMMFNKKELLPGESFGEISLMTNQTRTATMVCGEESWLLTLSKEGFDKLLGQIHTQELNQNAKFIGQFEIMKSLSNNRIFSLLHNMTKQTYRYNNIIYSENDEADKIYFIKSGQVEISKWTDLKESSLTEDNQNNSSNSNSNKRKSNDENSKERIEKSPKLDKKQIQSENDNAVINKQNQIYSLNRRNKYSEKVSNYKRVKLNVISENNLFGHNEINSINPTFRQYQAKCISEELEVMVIKKKILLSYLKISKGLDVFQKTLQIQNSWKDQLLIDHVKTYSSINRKSVEFLKEQQQLLQQQQIKNQTNEYNYQQPQDDGDDEYRDRMDISSDQKRQFYQGNKKSHFSNFSNTSQYQFKNNLQQQQQDSINNIYNNNSRNSLLLQQPINFNIPTQSIEFSPRQTNLSNINNDNNVYYYQDFDNMVYTPKSSKATHNIFDIGQKQDDNINNIKRYFSNDNINQGQIDNSNSPSSSLRGDRKLMNSILQLNTQDTIISNSLGFNQNNSNQGNNPNIKSMRKQIRQNPSSDILIYSHNAIKNNSNRKQSIQQKYSENKIRILDHQINSQNEQIITNQINSIQLIPSIQQQQQQYQQFQQQKLMTPMNMNVNLNQSVDTTDQTNSNRNSIRKLSKLSESIVSDFSNTLILQKSHTLQNFYSQKQSESFLHKNNDEQQHQQQQQQSISPLIPIRKLSKDSSIFSFTSQIISQQSQQNQIYSSQLQQQQQQILQLQQQYSNPDQQNLEQTYYYIKVEQNNIINNNKQSIKNEYYNNPIMQYDDSIKSLQKNMNFQQIQSNHFTDNNSNIINKSQHPYLINSNQNCTSNSNTPRTKQTFNFNKSCQIYPPIIPQSLTEQSNGSNQINNNNNYNEEISPRQPDSQSNRFKQQYVKHLLQITQQKEEIFNKVIKQQQQQQQIMSSSQQQNQGYFFDLSQEKKFHSARRPNMDYNIIQNIQQQATSLSPKQNNINKIIQNSDQEIKIKSKQSSSLQQQQQQQKQQLNQQQNQQDQQNNSKSDQLVQNIKDHIIKTRKIMIHTAQNSISNLNIINTNSQFKIPIQYYTQDLNETQQSLQRKEKKRKEDNNNNNNKLSKQNYFLQLQNQIRLQKPS